MLCKQVSIGKANMDTNKPLAHHFRLDKALLVEILREWHWPAALCSSQTLLSQTAQKLVRPQSVRKTLN